MKTKEIINEVFLGIDNLNFDWKVILEGSADQKTWSTILDDYRILAINGPNGDYQFTTLFFPQSNFEYYRVTIKTKDKVKFSRAILHFEKTNQKRYHELPLLSQIIDTDKKNKESIINIDLGQMQQVDQVQLRINNKGDYYRPVNIQMLYDSTLINKKWNYHYRSIFSGTLSSLQAPRFDFAGQYGQKFKIKIRNYDNPVLDIGAVTLRNRIRSIYSKLPKGELFLCYGYAKASSPNYDLKYFKDDIQLDGNSVELSPEKHNPISKDNTAKALFDNQWWLWVLLFSLVVGLGWVSLKMLREK